MSSIGYDALVKVSLYLQDEDYYGNPYYSYQFVDSCGSYSGYTYVSNDEDCDDTIQDFDNDCSVEPDVQYCTGNFQVIVEDNIGSGLEGVSIHEDEGDRISVKRNF